MFQQYSKILSIFINYFFCCCFIRLTTFLSGLRCICFPGKNCTFVCNRTLMCTELLQGTFPGLKTIRYKDFLMMTFCAKHTARKAKCFINTWAVFQPFELSIPLSAKITTMTIKRILTPWLKWTMSFMKYSSCSINTICRIS